MRMEQVCVCQGYLQQHLNNIADSTVIWQSDLLGSADEIPQTEYRGVFKNATAVLNRHNKSTFLECAPSVHARRGQAMALGPKAFNPGF